MSRMSASESDFPRVSIEDLPSSVRARLIRLKLREGELLFREGEPTEMLYFLESGVIRLLHYTGSGQTVEHYSVGTGEFFAEVLMLATVCTCTAIAEKMSQVLMIPKSAWIEAITAHHNLAMAYIGSLSDRIDQLETLIRLRGIRMARERVWSYITLMAHPETRILPLERPLKAIARDLDLKPETLSRVLGQLTRENVIERNTKMIRILE